MWNAGWRVRLGVQRTEEGGGGQQPELQEFAHIPSVVQPRLPATTRVQHEATGNEW